MNWKFDPWLRQHRAEFEARWLEVSQNSPAYDALTADEKLSCWAPLVEALMTARGEDLEEEVRRWAAREARERGATPSDLLAIAEALSRAVQDLLPTLRVMGEVDGRLNALIRALAHVATAEAERLAEEKSQLETLYEITRELTASLDLRRMLHGALTEMMEAIEARMGSVFLLDEAKERVEPETTVEWESDGVRMASLPSAWRMGQAEPLLRLDDLEAESADAWVEQLAEPDVRSLMAAPLIAHGEFKGLVAVGSRRPDAFLPGHAQLFRAVLGQVGSSIGNAEVYRLIQDQSQELGEMLRHQREESSKRQAILTSIADGVVVNDVDGRTIMVNPAAARILDVPGDHLVGEDFEDLFAVFKGQEGEKAIAAMDSLLDRQASEMSKAYKMVLEIDRRVINAHLSPVRTEEGDFLGVVTILRDITKEVESERAKSEFISTVSHELRTPMTAIKGYTDLLHAGSVGTINNEQQRFLGIIKSNTDRLTALVNDLLDISRVETGRVRFEPQLMQLGNVISDVVAALAGQAEEKDLSLAYEVVGGLPEIMGDRDRLTQVLTNLIGNAIRYTPEGGEIEVNAYPVEEAVRVDVRDTGIGIAPEDLARIFERFYRANHPLVRETGGTGLGLSIVKMFVEMHGGRVWVESNPGEGSTFTFILPLPVRGEEGVERQVSPRLMARARRILVVDDERDVANLVKVQLKERGYDAHVLGSGGVVLDWVEENRPDLIILDLLLPDVNGTDVLRALKDNDVTAEIPVIALTIVPDDGTVWELGVADYLTKPIDGEELLESVERALTWQGRVLIVEDHPDTVDMLSAAMRRIGFTPLVAAGGYEALAKARRYRPEIVLLDLRLPGMDGYEALTHFKRDAVTHAIPIVAISAHVSDEEQERKRLIALGASSFLPKPFSIEELLDEVEAALQPLPGLPST